MKSLLLIFLVIFSFAFVSATEKRNVTIEVSIITDFGLFKKWYAFYQRDGVEAVKGIYYMYSNVFRRVRERFWGVEMDGVRFDIRFANTHVSYNPANTTFVEANVENGILDQDKVVDALKEFIKTSPIGFNSSDVNVLVTGYKLKSGEESFMKGSLISDEQVNMVITEVGQHRTTDFLTRKLSEALGGFSDVTDREINDQRFIMTADRKEENFEHVDNIDKFSPATQKLFEEHFKTKRYPWDQTPPVDDKFDVYWCASTHPFGQTYPAHRQCKFMYGPTSSTCTDAKSVEVDICLRLGCTDPANNHMCTFAGDQRAYDRTSCGDGCGKWCLGAKCVTDEKAPPTTKYDNYVKYP